MEILLKITWFCGSITIPYLSGRVACFKRTSSNSDQVPCESAVHNALRKWVLICDVLLISLSKSLVMYVLYYCWSGQFYNWLQYTYC